VPSVINSTGQKIAVLSSWLIQVVNGRYWRLSQRQPTFKKNEECNAANCGNEHYEHLKLPRVTKKPSFQFGSVE
jgi:hypothetical protein